MFVFGMLMVALIIFDLIVYVKKDKNALMAYLIIFAVAMAIGLFYFSEPTRPSFSYELLSILGIKF